MSRQLVQDVHSGSSSGASTRCTDAKRMSVTGTPGTSGSTVATVRVHNSDTSADPTAIHSIIHTLLKNLNVSYPTDELDLDLVELCREEAVRRGYPMDGPKSLDRFILLGAALAIEGYSHLNSTKLVVFIAFVTAFLLYTDDIFVSDTAAVSEFQKRYEEKLPQKLPILDHLAALIREMYEIYDDPIAANLAVTSTLNFITGLIVEYETVGRKISQSAASYPWYVRELSGGGIAFAIFAFPPDIPARIYLQALPEMNFYMNHINDLCSFYKEEMANETVNYVSILAQIRGKSKIEALKDVALEVEDAYRAVTSILAGSDSSSSEKEKGAKEESDRKRAQAAWEASAKGYITYHAKSPRYRLKELNNIVANSLKRQGV